LVEGKVAKKFKLQPLTEEERETLIKLIKSQTAPAIEVERAKTIWLARLGEKKPRLHISEIVL
jgi:hypothetical protein